MKRLRKAKPNVEILLREEPETRGDDKLLTVRYLQKFHNAVYITDILNSDVPPLESIRRSRQKLQEKGDYLPPAIILNVREDEQKEYIEFARE